MSRRGWYILFLAVMVAVYAFACLKFDKFGSIAPATLCGFPVWIVTAIALGLFLLGGLRYRPVVEPGVYTETPGCVFQLFIGFFFLAMFLGIFFTEPIICTGRDGDVCYEYGTSTANTYQGYRNDGSSYRYRYRNDWVWITDPTVDAAFSAGSWIGDMDLDDSEAMIFIVIVIVLLILVLSSAFIPNMWVLACALCIGATYLAILRLSNAEKATAEAKKKHKIDGKSKPKNGDPLLADPAPPNPESARDLDVPLDEHSKPKNDDSDQGLAPIPAIDPARDNTDNKGSDATHRHGDPLLADPAPLNPESARDLDRPIDDTDKPSLPGIMPTE